MFEKEIRELELLDSELPENRRDAVHGRVARRAERSQREALSALRGLDVRNPEESIRYGLLIEALAMESTGLADLLGGEFRRLHSLCTSDPSRPALWALKSFELLERSEEYRSMALALHLESLNSANSHIRGIAIWCLRDWSISRTPALREAIERRLEDPSWRVRQGAESALREEELLPRDYRVPWKDRVLRGLFSSRTKAVAMTGIFGLLATAVVVAIRIVLALLEQNL